jgi:hypothetical protein
MMLHLFPQFRGYNLRTLAARLRHRSQVFSGQQAGARILRPEQAMLDTEGAEFLSEGPVLMHAERESVDFASWLGSAFVWTPPKLGFSAAEQDTLALALRGRRDQDIAAECHVSTSTIKKRWDSILARVAGVGPDLFPSWSATESRIGRRGPEKRTDLLQYLAAHLEELRPYDSRCREAVEGEGLSRDRGRALC